MTRKFLSCFVGGLLLAQGACNGGAMDEPVSEAQLASTSSSFQGRFGYGDELSGVVGAGDPFDYAILEADAGDEVFFQATSDFGDNLVLFVYRWTGSEWAELDSNDNCFEGTLDACLTVSLDTDETYAALVTSFAYASRGIEGYARYRLAASCFSCDTRRPGVPEGGDCGGIGALECAAGLVCDRSNNGPGCSSSGICARFEPNAFCTRVYAPVCGCDGHTYDNDCKRRASYVALFRRGPC